MPGLRLMEQLSHGGSRVNEDLFNCNEQAAWILDGASGIARNTIPGAPSDPNWLVNTLNEELVIGWNEAAPTCAWLRLACDQVISRYDRLLDGKAPPLTDRPTACLTIVRRHADTLEISNAGDCWVVHESAGRISAYRNDLGDAAERPRMEARRLRALGLPQEELTRRMLPHERAFRATANVDGGYDIVDLTTRWVDRMKVDVLDIRAGDRVLLMTDGFYRLVDVFQRYDAPALLQAVDRIGLPALYDELREIEAGDEQCTRFHRMKARDDATAALLQVL